ncbi:hypothetical protein K7432_006458 [Basidiobolus ranarum]|uniref:Maintenance of telomere capping protein 6 n=1 Tax=Basidiobolus ranarum TaxID=34480 RepID=A0ABR2W212_9FUNG
MRASSLLFLGLLAFCKIEIVFGQEETINQWGPLYVKNSLLTQRDLSWEVPIDRLNHIGINLTTAYFQGKDYSTPKVQGIVDLVKAGYTRLLIDLYWNPDRSQWQFCPVSTTVNNETTANDIKCSTEAEFSNFLAFLDHHVSTMNSMTPSFLIVLLFRLHSLNTLGVVNPLDILYDMINRSLGSSIYTRTKLEQSRMSLPHEWIATGQYYYVIDKNPNTGYLESPSAWPTYSYLNRYVTPNRVLLGYDLGSSLSAYQLSTRLIDSLFFASSELYVPERLDSNGGFNSDRCLNSSSPSLLQSNNLGLVATQVQSSFWSWRTITQPLDSTNFTEDSISALTDCGYSLTFSAPGVYNEVNIIPAIWSWEPDQPDPYGRYGDQRCVVMNAQSGHWRVRSCDRKLPIACLSRSNLSDWVIENQKLYSYEAADGGCPAGYYFSIPKTARDSLYLARSLNASGESQVWIDLNAIQRPGCWVVGKNSPCLYNQTYQFLNQILTVSLIGGLIALIIFIVFVYFKCRTNLRQRRSRVHREKVRSQIRKRETITVPA